MTVTDGEARDNNEEQTMKMSMSERDVRVQATWQRFLELKHLDGHRRWDVFKSKSALQLHPDNLFCVKVGDKALNIIELETLLECAKERAAAYRAYLGAVADWESGKSE